MEKLVYDTAQQTWKKISNKRHSAPSISEIDVFKKMLDIVQIGDYFYVIFNVVEARIEFCENRVHEVLGYSPEEFTVDNFLEMIHPDDLPVYLDFEAEVASFYANLLPSKVQKYKVRYDYRIRTKGGVYKRFLQQVVTVQSDIDGAVLRTLAVFTDIGYLKKETSMTLSIIGLDGEKSHMNLLTTKLEKFTSNPLSDREVQVLKLLAEGNSSKEIAFTLGLSQNTVSNHRKNMLRKSNSRTSTGLLRMALENAWM